MSAPASAVPAARTRRDPGRVLWAVTGIAWVVLVGLEFVVHGHLAHPAHAAGGLQDGPLAWPLVLAMFAGGWLVMVAAMMLPTMVPMARMYSVVSAGQGAPGRARTAFYGSYFGIWLAFAAVGMAGALATAALVARSDWLAARPSLVLAAALALAGAFQFSPLKWSCLTACREPAGFLFQHYGRGPGAAWALGVRHALSCLGCCWALMLVMFAVGASHLAWMLALTAVMVAEKATRWGHRLVAPIGIVLLWLALLVAVGGFEPTGHQH